MYPSRQFFSVCNLSRVAIPDGISTLLTALVVTDTGNAFALHERTRAISLQNVSDNNIMIRYNAVAGVTSFVLLPNAAVTIKAGTLDLNRLQFFGQGVGDMNIEELAD